MVPSKRSLTAHYKRDEKKAGPTDKKEVKNEAKNDESWADIMENEERCSKNGSQRGSQEKLTELESDPLVLQRRQKQIDYGKNTLAYDNYINLIPRCVVPLTVRVLWMTETFFLSLPIREERKKEHPKTPNKYEKYSRRGWDGTVKVWKKMLHAFEPEGVQAKSSQPAPVQKKKTTDAADALDESFEDLAFDILDE